MTDQESNNYKTTILCNRTLIAENYRAVTMTNGQKKAFAKEADYWMKYFESNTPCYTYANLDLKNKSEGIIYNYFAALSKYLAPESWTVPTSYDWDKMVFSIGQYNSKTALKLNQNTAWKSTKDNVN